MAIDLSLQQYLYDLNESLRKEKEKGPDKGELRNDLYETIGRFSPLRKLTEREMAVLAEGRPLVGVDGSVYTLGGNYPFSITAFQAVAKATCQMEGQGDKVTLSSLYSPLDKKDRDALRVFMEEQEEEWTEETAFSRYKDRRMALLEMEAAIEAVKRFRPFLVLLDGPFSRYHADQELLERWKTFCQAVDQQDTWVVGVVEEIGTMKLNRFLSPSLQEKLMTGHDREILFGLLEPGEALLPKKDIEIKGDAYVTFARFSDHPQAVACNFLHHQTKGVPELLNLLYTLTPKKGRGIPFWLDVVDVETRITKKEWDILVQSSVDSDLFERFLRPQRERRDY